MGFEVSDKAKEINERLEAFMEEHIYPREDWLVRDDASAARFADTLA